MEPRISLITLAHNVRRREEVDELLKQAEAAGARMEKPAQDTEWGGYRGYFSDADGYLWEVAWGAFEFREDGSLIIPWCAHRRRSFRCISHQRELAWTRRPALPPLFFFATASTGFPVESAEELFGRRTRNGRG